VIAATATAPTLEDAIKRSYTGISTIHFDGMHYRKDIAHRAFKTNNNSSTGLTYASAGVSIDAGNDLVNRIKSCVARTRRAGSDAIIGGFGGAFSLAAANSGYHSSSPTLIGAIDGVGTKLKIAHAMGIHNTVGIDLVAMNVNDLVVQGAEPLFFLDCYSCSSLNVETASAFVSGVADGCVQAGCALVGGETAEMPGLFVGDSYDAVGAAVGAINTNDSSENGGILPNTSAMKLGDIILGLASSGPHSNGYSLIRKIVERSGLSYSDTAPFNTNTHTSSSQSQSVGLALLTPTRIYVKPLLAALSKSSNSIKGLAHITGGGLLENVPRMLPAHLSAAIDTATWPFPDVFRWLKATGGVSALEMGRAFNCGVGMVVVVEKGVEDAVASVLEESGERVWKIGELVERVADGKDEGCRLKNLDRWDCA
jgi:phosphoribosylamine--glycine ligase/phosphoribosylformylglycinamidine cyclo-ligase